MSILMLIIKDVLIPNFLPMPIQKNTNANSDASFQEIADTQQC